VRSRFFDVTPQAEVARLVDDAYADLAARHPKRFKGFASIPMDDPDAALRELERTQGELRMKGVIVRSRTSTDARSPTRATDRSSSNTVAVASACSSIP
jgi:2,3-dihydroxybenzoate decarboxylase